MIKDRKSKSLTKHCFIITRALTDGFSAGDNDAFEKPAIVVGNVGMGRLIGYCGHLISYVELVG